jgi:hypothetical protein
MNVEEIFNHTPFLRILVLVVSSLQFGHIHKSRLQCLTHEPKNNVLTCVKTNTIITITMREK